MFNPKVYDFVLGMKKNGFTLKETLHHAERIFDFYTDFLVVAYYAN